MPWRDILLNAIRKPAEHWVYTHIPAERATVPCDQRIIEPGKSYLRLKLVQMFLGDERTWHQTHAPVVHAFPRFLHHDGYVEMPVVIGPSTLDDLSGKRVQRVISLNQTVLGPLPYLGGDLRVALALFAMKTEDYATRFVELLGAVSDIAPTTGLAAAHNVLKPLQKGLEEMLGLGDLQLRVGVQDTFSSAAGGALTDNVLRSGHRVLIAKDANTFHVDELWITERGVCTDDGGLPGKLLAGCDYLVFHVQCLESRDWRELPPLNTAWRRVEKAIETGDDGAIDRAFNVFKWTLLASGDLILTDRTSVLREQAAVVRDLLAAADTSIRNLLPDVGREKFPASYADDDIEFTRAAAVDWRK